MVGLEKDKPFIITVEEENGQPGANTKQTNVDHKEGPGCDASVEKPVSGDPASSKEDKLAADGPKSKCCTKTNDCCGRMLLAYLAFALIPLFVLPMAICCSEGYIATFYVNQYRTLCCCGCCFPSRLESTEAAKPEQPDLSTPDTLTPYQLD